MRHSDSLRRYLQARAWVRLVGWFIAFVIAVLLTGCGGGADFEEEERKQGQVCNPPPEKDRGRECI